MSACSKIRSIARLRQLLRCWSKNSSRRYAPSDVPSGHVAVCVGLNCTRFVIRTTYLNHPVFEKLLMLAEEEYGFANNGPLVIPCDELVFEEILRFLAQSDSSRPCRKTGVGLRIEARPLLDGIIESRPNRIQKALAEL